MSDKVFFWNSLSTLVVGCISGELMEKEIMRDQERVRKIEAEREREREREGEKKRDRQTERKT